MDFERRPSTLLDDPRMHDQDVGPVDRRRPRRGRRGPTDVGRGRTRRPIPVWNGGSGDLSGTDSRQVRERVDGGRGCAAEGVCAAEVDRRPAGRGREARHGGSAGVGAIVSDVRPTEVDEEPWLHPLRPDVARQSDCAADGPGGRRDARQAGRSGTVAAAGTSWPATHPAPSQANGQDASRTALQANGRRGRRKAARRRTARETRTAETPIRSLQEEGSRGVSLPSRGAVRLVHSLGSGP